MEANLSASCSKIDMDSWERKEYFLHYYNDVRYTYSVTANVDIFTTGKLIKENGRVKLPSCLQIHHSICDGYHAGQLFDYLQELADEAADWVK